MNENDRIDAENMLNTLLTKQPGMLSGLNPNEDSGKAIADFCAAFIRQYSEHLKKLNSESRR